MLRRVIHTMGLAEKLGVTLVRRMRTFPAIPQSVHAARRFATDALAGCPPMRSRRSELMVSELATNCIRHERMSFYVTITQVGAGDPRRGDRFRQRHADDALSRPNEPSGRGLQIVDMLSHAVGDRA